MRKLLIIIIWLVTLPIFATNYYVKTGGNDGASGLDDANAWATITKVNTIWAAGTFAPGDNIYFKRGDTFTGTITVTESGSAGNTITIGAYGTGANPIINGFTTVTGWTNEGGGIYSKSITAESSCLVVSVDGTLAAMGREPETGWTTFDGSSGNTQLTDATLSGLDWTGAEAVVRINAFIINHTNISAHVGSTITFGAMTSSLLAGNGFFIQNDLGTLDTFGEWYYNNSTHVFYMYFGAEATGDHSVKVATIDNGIEIVGYSYLTVDGLDITGFNASNIYLDDCPNTIITNCDISYGFTGIDGTESGNNTSGNCTFSNNNIDQILNCGILLYGTSNDQFNNVTISNNNVDSIGLLRGMGESLSIVTYYGIGYMGTSVDNTSSIIEYNRVTNIGYIGIEFNVDDTEVRYNYVDGYCLILTDGGGLYTYRNTGWSVRNAYVHHNIVLNGYGDYGGHWYTSETQCFGLYGDGLTESVRWEYNTVAYNTRYNNAGYIGNGGTNGTLRYNTFFDNSLGARIPSPASHTNFIMTNNIFFSRTANQYAFYYSGSSDLTASCITDYNYYCNPLENDDNSILYYITPSTIYYWNLSEFRAYRGQDAHSNDTPVPITLDSQIHFIYNDSNVNESYTLSTTMYEPNGTGHTLPVTLTPFTSMILLGTGTVTLYEEEEALVVLTTTVAVGTSNATVGGNVIDEGASSVTVRGVCWSTSADPTTADSHTSNGSGLGSYNVYISGLLPSTTYHARAYATNTQGTGYGDDVEFTTTTDVGLAGDPVFINGKVLFKDGKIVVK